MRNVVIYISLALLCCSCNNKNYQDVENKLLSTEGVIYLIDNDQNQYEATVYLEREESLALWKIIRSGIQATEQNDQGLGWFKFHLKNNKTIFVELGQSGTLRYDSHITKIDLSLFNRFIVKHFKDESGKQIHDPNILNFPK